MYEKIIPHEAGLCYHHYMTAKFTEEQKRAIETLDKSVLVSAAAGSGKTAVLIERIIRIILDGRANVDEMLVVTFTNAAACEMRLRLSKAIRKRASEHPEDAARMKDQLARLYKAYISTIDSFALRVIREFFHETDLEPSFGVCDDIRGELLRREAIDELFEEAFACDDIIEGGSFRAFLRLYSDERSDEDFKDRMLTAYSKLRSMPDYFDWAFEKAEQLRVSAESFEGSELQRMMTEDARETFGRVSDAMKIIRQLFSDAGLEGMFESKLLVQAEFIENICLELSGGSLSSEVINSLNAFPGATVRAKKDQQEAYDSIKAEVKELRDVIKKETDGFRNRYLIPDFETRLSEMNATYEYTVYYLKLLREFEKRYEQKKHEHRLIDFADMEHYAVRILKNDEAADILRRRFRYIFVDEYQDTNNIQECLISRIARPDNVFRVGDVKQSIYKFRQAEPEIFEKLYASYSEGENPDGVVIDLGRNFRSNDRTIKYINHVFSRIMDGYDERAMLYTGLSDIMPEYDFMPEVHLLTEDNGNTDEAADAGAAGYGTDGYAGSGPEDADESEYAQAEDITKEEAEAEYIAKLAESIIGTEFYDSKAKTVRRAGARDIVILFRAVRYRGEIMSRALRERSIEPHVEATEDYFDTVEIGVALSLLTCIDNMKRDVPLIAVLHSEIFSFSPEELGCIRIAHTEHMRAEAELQAQNDAQEDAVEAGGVQKRYIRPAYWQAFEWYMSEGPEGELKDKACSAGSRLLEWRLLSRLMPLDDFVWKVLTDSGYYSMAGAMSGGASRQANLRALADRAGSFSREGIASLSSFITFLDLMRRRRVSNGQASMAGSDDDVIRISTIHKSKGLEYPFVIVGGLGHRFRPDSNEKGFSFDSGTGVGLPYIDPSRKYWRSTVIQRAINSKTGRDVYREELRLLYVAMTRARNKLYLVGTVKSEEELAKYTARPNSYIKAMRGVLKSGFNKYISSPLVLAKEAGSRDRQDSIRSYIDKPLSESEQKLYDEIDRRFSFVYPFSGQLSSKAKYSVSEIRRAENEAAASSGSKEEAASDLAAAAAVREDENTGNAGISRLDTEVVRLWDANERKKRASAADTGIAYHRIMEFLDFDRVTDADGNIDEAYINERAEFLHSHNAIEDEVFRALDLTRIAAFFASDLGRRALAAASAGTLRREKPFTLRTERDGREMLVQGVIDCCFEEDGKMVLIDYKSVFIRPGRAHAAETERVRKEYKVQTELYSEAIRKGTGKEVAASYLWLFTTAEAISM